MKGDRKICHYCGEITKNPTRDHIFPLSKIRRLKEKGSSLPDGVNLEKNKVWACGPCNTNKGNKDYESFKALGLKQIKHMKRMFLNRTIKKHSRKRRK